MPVLYDVTFQVEVPSDPYEAWCKASRLTLDLQKVADLHSATLVFGAKPKAVPPGPPKDTCVSLSVHCSQRHAFRKWITIEFMGGSAWAIVSPNAAEPGNEHRTPITHCPWCGVLLTETQGTR